MRSDSGDVSEAALAELFTSGERLGWTFEKHKHIPEPFREQQPGPPVFDSTVVQEEADRRKLYAGVSIALTVLFLVLSSTMDGFFEQVFGLLFLASAIAAVVSGLRNRGSAITRFERGYVALQEHRAQTELAEWNRRKSAHEAGEENRLARLPSWAPFAATAAERRIEVYGGNLWGWEALLTVYGASALATRPPVTVLDLSNGQVANELARLAVRKGLPVQRELLPAQLALSELATALDREALVACIVEAIHGGSEPADRRARTTSSQLLARIVGALEEPVRIGRLLDAIRTVLGDTPTPTRLSEDEKAAVSELLTDAELHTARTELQHLVDSLGPLQQLAEQAAAGTAPSLRCYVIEDPGTSVSTETLTDFVVQCISHTISAPGTLIVAGADDLARRHIERLSKACERRGVKLMLLFEHLREASLQVLGGGTVGFMRLGNHEEADRAAAFIGRSHKFMVSQFTNTVSGSHTHTEGRTEGFNESRGVSYNRSVTGPLIGAARAVSVGSNQGTTDTVSRNWGKSESIARGVSLSEAQSLQRVYELDVEPRHLQHLPDYALLVVTGGPAGPSITTVDCNPDIATIKVAAPP